MLRQNQGLVALKTCGYLGFIAGNYPDRHAGLYLDAVYKHIHRIAVSKLKDGVGGYYDGIVSS